MSRPPKRYRGSVHDRPKIAGTSGPDSEPGFRFLLSNLLDFAAVIDDNFFVRPFVVAWRKFGAKHPSVHAAMANIRSDRALVRTTLGRIPRTLRASPQAIGSSSRSTAVCDHRGPRTG